MIIKHVVTGVLYHAVSSSFGLGVRITHHRLEKPEGQRPLASVGSPISVGHKTCA